MDYFIKACAGILIVLTLSLTLSKEGKNFSYLLTILSCSIVLIGAISILQPVISFIGKLEQIGSLDSAIIDTLLKVVGVGLLAEVIGSICGDMGNGAIGKSLKILSTALILQMSIPILSQMIELIEDILDNL